MNVATNVSLKMELIFAKKHLDEKKKETKKESKKRRLFNWI